MTDLIQRLTDATVNERGLFEEAFELLFPEPGPGCEPTWRRENPKQPKYHAWKTRKIAFRRMLDAEAWTSAAEMLVPAGCSFDLSKEHAVQGGTWLCLVGSDDGWGVNGEGHGQTPALALLIAALKAHGSKETE